MIRALRIIGEHCCKWPRHCESMEVGNKEESYCGRRFISVFVSNHLSRDRTERYRRTRGLFAPCRCRPKQLDFSYELAHRVSAASLSLPLPIFPIPSVYIPNLYIEFRNLDTRSPYSVYREYARSFAARLSSQYFYLAIREKR